MDQTHKLSEYNFIQNVLVATLLTNYNNIKLFTLRTPAAWNDVTHTTNTTFGLRSTGAFSRLTPCQPSPTKSVPKRNKVVSWSGIFTCQMDAQQSATKH